MKLSTLLLTTITLSIVFLQINTVVTANFHYDKAIVVILDVVEELIRQSRESNNNTTNNNTIENIANQIKSLILTSTINSSEDLQVIMNMVRLVAEVANKNNNNNRNINSLLKKF